MVYGVELAYKDGAAYGDAENQSWCMELSDPFEESEGVWRTYSLTGDDRLVVSSEYRSEPEEEYEFYSLDVDIYLRKDSPEFNDAENLRYFDTVKVSSATDLLNSIQNNRKIIVEEGVYNFSNVTRRKIKNDRVRETIGAFEVQNISNLCIEAEDGAEVQFCIDDPSNPVFSFNGGRNITIRNITVGHTVEPGYCSGSVLYFYSVNGVDVDKCKLYGSGTYGVEAMYTYGVKVTNTEIYECTYGLVSLEQVGDVLFKDCVMRDSGDLSLICTRDAYDVLFEGCEFSGNRANAYEEAYFVSSGEYDRVSFKDCSFKDNEFSAFSNYEVTLENCTSDNNHAGFKELLDASDSSETLSKEDILANYENALKRQGEIDEKLQSDALLDQRSLNQLAYEEYGLWDTLLNQIWAYLGENLEEKKMEALREEQRKWIREKEASMKEAGADFEGGSMQPMVEYGNGASLTQKRVQELVEQYVKGL